MTPRQQKTIDQLKKQIIDSKSCGKPELYEFKEITVKESDYFVSFVTEYGRKNDEGTVAAIMCRDRRHFIIGLKGGVKLVGLSANMHSSTPPSTVRGVFKCVNFYHRKVD